MDIFFKIKLKRNKFICSILSALAYLLGYSCIMESGNFSVYFVSYIHYHQKWVDIQYGNLMSPVVLLFLSGFSPLSGLMETLLGSRLSLLTSAVVIEITYIFFYFQKNLWIFYILSLFLGFGCGLSANITIKNCCLYYPKKKGFISACIMSLGALIGSSFTLFGEKIINPDRKQVIDKEKDPYYPKEIAERAKYYFLFAVILLPIATTISLFLFYKYDPSCEIEDKEEEKIDNKIDEIKGPLLEGNTEENIENTEYKKEEITEKKNEEKEERENNKAEKEGDNNKKRSKKDEKINISNSFMKPSPKKSVKKALKNWRFWRNILISGVMPFGLFFIFATCRAYSSLLGVNGSIVGTLAGFMNIIGSVSNPIWAFCTDKYGFQRIMKIVSISMIALPVYFFIFMDNKIFYVIGLYVSCAFRGGVISSITPHIMQIFGLRYYLTLGGFVRLFNQLFSFLIAMLSIIISIWNNNYKELLKPYRIVCIVGIIIAIFGFILVFYETDEKFNFDDEEKDQQKENKKKKEGKKEEGSQKEENKVKEQEQQWKENIMEEGKDKKGEIIEGKEEASDEIKIKVEENNKKDIDKEDKKEIESCKNEYNLENKEEKNENIKIEKDKKEKNIKKDEDNNDDKNNDNKEKNNKEENNEINENENKET